MTIQWGNAEVAKIIVGDTIRSAHTKPQLAKDATVQDSLDLLNGPDADRIVQAVLGEYLLSHTAAEVAGVNASIDRRLLTGPADFIKVSATGLKFELQQLLQDYLSKPADERNILVQALISDPLKFP